jgi:hypothetical protein
MPARYTFAPTEACVIAAFGDKPLSLSVVLSSRNSSLSVDMPSIDDAHAGQIQIVLVVADKKAGANTQGASSTTYEIDTRPTRRSSRIRKPSVPARASRQGKDPAHDPGQQRAAELQRRDGEPA